MQQTTKDSPIPLSYQPPDRARKERTRLSWLAVISIILSIATTPWILRYWVPRDLIHLFMKWSGAGLFIFPMIPVISLLVSIISIWWINRSPRRIGLLLAVPAFLISGMSTLFGFWIFLFLLGWQREGMN